MTPSPGTAAFFVLRTPLLPVETLLDWGSGLGARSSYERGDPLGPALAADRAQLRERLGKLLARPEVREAIFVASPSLDEAIEHWIKNPDSEKGRRAERGLVRYLCRMAVRPTPFGLFAGISTGIVGKETKFRIGERGDCRRHTRLDNDYLFALMQALARDPAIRETVRLRPNDSLSSGSGRFRYVEARLDGTLRNYHLVSAEDTPELRSTLLRAGAGKTRGELSQALVGDDVELADADRFIDELIESQVLVPDLALPVTGAEPLPTLLRDLASHPSQTGTVNALQAVETTLAEFDRLGHAEPAAYRALAKTLEPLPAKAELATLFQVDLVRPAPDLSLGSSLLREIDRGIDVLHRLGGLRGTDPLARFRDAFRERYEETEVPLLEALDDEVGLGSLIASAGDPSPLLRGVTWPDSPDTDLSWGEREHHQLHLLASALEGGRQEISLDPKDLERLAIPSDGPLPPSFEVLATVLAPSAAAVERGDFRLWIDSASGPPGARYLGRFCHVDKTLAGRIPDLLRAEELHEPDAIYAEVVHLPDGRMGNILLRPQLRSHEITYLGRSGAPLESQILPGDLTLSLHDKHFLLRSTRLGRRVIPRLTTAHAWNRGLGVYRFLCMLQFEGISDSLAWNWGPLASAPYLPRIRVGRIILCPQRWNLTAEECKRLGAPDDDERFRTIQNWRKERRLPRLVALTMYDNRLPVDLDNALSVDAFAHEIKQREGAVLEEVFLGSEDLVVEGPDGHYAHEIVVPFVRTLPVAEPPSRRAAEPRPSDPQERASATRERGSPLGPSRSFASLRTGSAAESANILRQFPPGSEWLTAKLYTGEATADEILTEVIAPVTRSLLESASARGWFFIRYADPEHHIRWRLNGEPQAMEAAIRPAVEAAVATLLGEGKVWRVQFDTYRREIERYGGPEGIRLAEQLFQADSDAVLQILELLDPGDAGLDERWRLAVRGMDQLLQDLGLDQVARRDYAARWIEETAKAQGHGKLRAQLTERYRKDRGRLEPLLDHNQDHDSTLEPGLAVLGERSRRLAPIGTELRRLEQEGRLTVPVSELARSFVHMHVNRLIRGAPTQHELILHDFLHRLYQAQAARATAPEPAADPAL